jgi:hypothetical protein
MLAAGVALSLSMLGTAIGTRYTTINTEVENAGRGNNGNHAGGGNNGNGRGNGP